MIQKKSENPISSKYHPNLGVAFNKRVLGLYNRAYFFTQSEDMSQFLKILHI